MHAHVAVKILSRHATLFQDRVSHELQHLLLIQSLKSSSTNAGSAHVVGLLDHFKIESEHGNHLCLVTEVLGCSVKELRQHFGGRMPTAIVKRITKQLLMALSYLHGECHIIHTGTVSPFYSSPARGRLAACMAILSYESAPRLSDSRG